MKKHNWKNVLAGLSASLLCVATAQAADIKEDYHSTVNGSSVILMKDNYLTQKLGGRLVNLDVWAGEFVQFTDNLYNTQKKTSDTIFSTAAGFLMQANQKDSWNARVAGQFQYNKYARHNEYSGFEGSLASSVSVVFAPALTGRIKFNYDRTNDNIRDVQDIYVTNEFLTGAGVTFAPSPFMDIDLDYSFYAKRRENSIVKFQEYNEHTVSLRPSYELTPNTAVYVSTAVSFIRPVQDYLRTAQAYSGVMGMLWAYKDTMSVNVEAGYKYMSFGHGGTIADWHTSHGSPVAKLAAKYAFTPDWSVGTTLIYAPTYGALSGNTNASNYVDTFSLAAFLRYAPGSGRFVAELQPYYNFYNPSNNVRYNEYGASISCSYVVTEWLNVTAAYRYGVLDYSNAPSRNRNRVTLGVALTY